MEVQLVMADRQGIEIDYCPQCRGVWLDRGELDKIIDRASPSQPQQTTATPVRPASMAPERVRDERVRDERDYRDDRRYSDDRRYHDDDDDRYPRRKKRSGILGEIFDFD
jgi:hypothetical protein